MDDTFEQEEKAYSEWVDATFTRHRETSLLLKAYRLRDARIAEKLRALFNLGDEQTPYFDNVDGFYASELADELERDLSVQQAAEMLHLEGTP